MSVSEKHLSWVAIIQINQVNSLLAKSEKNHELRFSIISHKAIYTIANNKKK